jgi:hypothetical protein
LSRQKSATPNRRFKFHKRRQPFIRTHNETLSVIAVRVNDPDRSAYLRSFAATSAFCGQDQDARASSLLSAAKCAK